MRAVGRYALIKADHGVRKKTKDNLTEKAPMKTRVSLALVLLAIVGSGTLYGQGKAHNGFWWVDLPESYKLGFVAGYADAMTDVRDHNIWKCVREKGHEAQQTCVRSDVDALDFISILHGQLREGLDEFYRTFLNKRIDIAHAMFYVRDQLKGKSAKELEEELDSFRKLSQDQGTHTP